VIAEIVERMYAAGKSPNQELKDMLLNAPFARSSFKMIKGPPGCGNTIVIAMLVQLSSSTKCWRRGSGRFQREHWPTA
jgi:ABC-type iron transport system FetAB ATPase subunit